MLLQKMPDAALLMLINTQKVYFDIKSIESSTGVEKPKYKLAGNFFSPMGIYTFFVITSNQSACHGNTTVKVETAHWEDKNPKHLNKPESFIDTKKIEVLAGKNVAEKMRDPDNGFLKVARLCDHKYLELKTLSNKKFDSSVSDQKKKIVEQALSDVFDINQVNDDILDKLGLG